MKQNTIFQAAAIVAAGIVLALVANAFASRDRKVSVVGTYPNALKVPAREVTTAPVSAATPATQTVAAAIPQPTILVPPPPPTATSAPATMQPTATAAIETVGLNPHAKNPAAPATTTATTAPAPHPPPATTEFKVHPDKPYIEIAYNDVKALHDRNVLFLDARRTSVYEQGHIPGARTYSVWESDIDDKVNKLFAERNDQTAQNLPIVIYCSGGDCEDSHMLAQKLWGIQFNNVYVYKDGFPDWQQHGAPVHTGANP